MAAKKTMRQAIKELEKHRDRIGKERDAIREFLDEYESLLESCQMAHDDIDSAIQQLSQYA